MGDVQLLSWLALAAIEHGAESPFGHGADGVEPGPEDRRHAGVARVLDQPAALATLDLPGRLSLEPELEPAVVDRPRAVALDQEAAVGGGHQVVERPRVAGLEVHVGHAHERLAREALGAHAAARPGQSDLGRGLARGEEAPQDTVAN